MSLSPPLRIGGWLLAPLAWLILTLLGNALTVALYVTALLSSDTHPLLSTRGDSQGVLWYFSIVCALALFSYSLWLTIAFLKRRAVVKKQYIIWLICTLLLAVKVFAFSPVSDTLALRQLLFSLLAAALLAPYFKRSVRVSQTFVNP